MSVSEAKGGPIKDLESSESYNFNDEASLVSIVTRVFRKMGVAIGVWFWGYMGFSLAWVFLGLFFHIAQEECRKQKLAKKAYAAHAARDERKAIQSRVCENLSWVYFPDVEKAEWLNKIIKQMWPYIADYVKDLLLNTIEPSVQENLATYNLKSFKFGKIDIGDVPPRIDGLKMYSEDKKLGEMICDLELFYSSDANIKVVAQGINAGIKTLQITGTLRVIMKPLISDIPIIGGVTVFFLNKPNISFDLTGAANLVDLPGLNTALKNIVEDQVSYYLVLPNRFPVALSSYIDEDTLAAMKYPLPQGVIALHVLEAAELKASDTNVMGKGTSDPYCKITVGAHTMRTSTQSSTLSPNWSEFFQIIVDQKHGQFVLIEVFDYDAARDDEPIGQATLDIELMAKSRSIDLWMPLENVKTGKIHLQANWLSLSKTLSLVKLRSGLESVVQFSQALLVVTVESATKLPVGEKSRKERNAYVKLFVGKNDKRTTVKYTTCEPVWQENFQFLVDDIEKQDLKIELHHKGSSDKNLSTLNVPLKTILTTDQPKKRTLDLPECGPRAQLTVSLCMRLLTTEPTASEDVAVPLPKSFATRTPPSMDQQTSSVDPQVQDNTPVILPTSPEVTTPNEPLVQRVIVPSNMSAVPPAESENKFGKIQVTIRYSSQRGQLVVVIHECKGLIPRDKDNLADPYVRVYLLPDSSKSTRKRTKMMKNTLNPVFDETFDWPMTLADASSRSLDIQVKNDVTLFSSSRTKMGNVLIDLSRIPDLQQATTAWFDLGDPEQD